VLPLKDGSARLTCLAFSPDSKRLAAGGEHVVRVWDLEARRLLRKISSGHCRAVYYSPDGTELFVQGWGALEAYRPDDGSFVRDRLPKRRPDRHVGCVSADGHAFLHYTATNSLARYRLADARLLWEKRFDEGYFSEFDVMACSRDGRLVACSNPHGRLYLHDAGTGRRWREVKGPGVWVKAVALSPDAGLVAWCATSHLYLWRLDPPAEVRHHSVGRTHFLAVAFHPSGEFFATANGDGKIDYWDAHTGAHQQAFDWGVGKINGVAFDANGDRAACCGEAGKVVVWDVDR
jgi:WD40 repeat protein